MTKIPIRRPCSPCKGTGYVGPKGAGHRCFACTGAGRR
jgi:DnaJ-class molecular chaperone